MRNLNKPLVGILRLLLISTVLLLFNSVFGSQQAPVHVDDNYLIGPEDEFAITVIKHPEFSSEFLVPVSGFIQVPVAGEIMVIGLSLRDINSIVTHGLRNRLMHPEVTVTLRLARVNRVYVLGDVTLPGSVDAKPGWTVSEALSAAGGLRATIEPKDVWVTITIKNRPDRHVSLIEAMASNGKDELQVLPGMTLHFDQTPSVPVYVTGKVSKPGLYPLRVERPGARANILQAISAAGGTLPDSALTRAKLIHPDGTSESVDLSAALVKGEVSGPVTLERGDTILIPELTEKFTILGFVHKPGVFPMLSGHTYTVADAISTAEGLAPRGRISRVGLLRIVDGKPIRRLCDLPKYLHKGDITQNPTLQPNDIVFVPETNSFETGTVLSALSTVAVLYYYFAIVK